MSHEALAPHDIIALGDGEVRMLDQTRLPVEVRTVVVTDWRELVEAIKRMVIRGAPALGVAASYGPLEPKAKRVPENCRGLRRNAEAQGGQ